jgi:hypothetical protein
MSQSNVSAFLGSDLAAMAVGCRQGVRFVLGACYADQKRRRQAVSAVLHSERESCEIERRSRAAGAVELRLAGLLVILGSDDPLCASTNTSVSLSNPRLLARPGIALGKRVL